MAEIPMEAADWRETQLRWVNLASFNTNIKCMIQIGQAKDQPDFILWYFHIFVDDLLEIWTSSPVQILLLSLSFWTYNYLI